MHRVNHCSFTDPNKSTQVPFVPLECISTYSHWLTLLIYPRVVPVAFKPNNGVDIQPFSVTENERRGRVHDKNI